MVPVRLWLLVLGSLLLMVAGCDRRLAKGEDQIVITYWAPSWWGDPSQFQGENSVSAAQWQRDRIRDFERDHPDIKVNVQIDPGGKGDKLRIAFAGRVPPDVFHGNPGQEFIGWASHGFLEPIDAYLSAEDRHDIRPAALNAGQYQGKHYAWPYYNHALCMMINRDLFRERGLASEIPGPNGDWNYDQLREFAQQLTFDRNNDGRMDVYGIGMHTLDANQEFITTYLINAGAQVFDESTGRFVLDSQAGMDGIRFLRDMYDAGYVTPGASGYQQEQIRDLFFNQQVAMYLGNAGLLDWAEDQVRKGTIKRFDWALVPVPHQAGLEQTTYLAVGAVYVSKQEDDAKRAASMALARYLTGPEINNHFWKRASPRRSTPVPADANMAVMMQQVERARNFMMPPMRLPDRFDLTNEMMLLYQDIFARPSRGEAGKLLQRDAEDIRLKLGQTDEVRQ